MTDTTNYVTQSKFFSPAFNAAIFDGPIRIYFAQHQEAQALKLYFNFQQRFGELRKQARGLFKDRSRNIFVMLYPNSETFDLSFADKGTVIPLRPSTVLPVAASVLPSIIDGSTATIVQGRLGADYVLGVCGPLGDQILEEVCLEMDAIIKAAEMADESVTERPKIAKQIKFDN